MLAIKPEREYSIPEVRDIRRRVINALARSAREVEGMPDMSKRSHDAELAL